MKRGRLALRMAFVLYAATLSTATHWPELQAPAVDIPDADKLFHAGAYFLWTALLLASGLTGDWRTRRARWTALGVALAYSAIDEATQLLPGLNRTTSLGDGAANWSGALLATLGAWALHRAAPAKTRETAQ